MTPRALEHQVLQPLAAPGSVRGSNRQFDLEFLVSECFYAVPAIDQWPPGSMVDLASTTHTSPNACDPAVSTGVYQPVAQLCKLQGVANEWGSLRRPHESKEATCLQFGSRRMA